MAERNFSAAEETLIARIEKTGAALEENQYGWGFVNATDKALKLIKKIAGIHFLDLFETCESGAVTDEGLTHIKDMADLRYVALGPGISDAGLENLAVLTEMQELRLDSAGDVTDEGLTALKDLTKIVNLSLQYTDVTDASLPQLAGLEQLKELNLEGTAVTRKAIAALKKKLSTCKVLWDAKTARTAKPSPKSASAATVYQLKLRTTLRGHGDKVGNAAFLPDGSLLASAGGGKMLVWDTATWTKRTTIVLKRGWLWGAAFTPDGKLVAAGSNHGCVYLWDAATGKEKMCLEAATQVITALDIDRSGQYLAAGGEDGKLYVWDVAKGDLVGSDTATAGKFFCAVAFSPDGKFVATATGEPIIQMWKVPSRQKLLELQAPPHTRDLAFSPDGAMLSSAHPDKRIRLWDLATSTEVAAFDCPKPVICLDYHPSGNLLATGSEGDSLVRLWDLTTQQSVAELETNADWDQVSLVAFSPDGKSLITNGKGGSLLVLDL